MSEVNQIVVHRSYTEELLYNVLKNDPVLLLQFFTITVLGLLAFAILYGEVRKSLTRLSNRFVKPQSQDPRQSNYRYGRENFKHKTLINIVSFTFSASVVMLVIMLIL